MEDFTGYQSNFIGDHLGVGLPKLNATLRKDVAPVNDSVGGELRYKHFSLVLSKSRRFPLFTATNINGSLFKKISRKKVFDSGTDEWKTDERAKAFQWGPSLYSAPKSDFQRGHMTKREDPQWGTLEEIARAAAQATFHFSNCVPQVAELNTKEWAKLETYILNKEAMPDKMFIDVFTGPVLSPHDPVFVTRVGGDDVLIPTHFWKVVYYTNDGKSLSKVGFLMGQEKLLFEKGVTGKKKMNSFRTLAGPNHFEDFEDAKTYQVNLSTITGLSGLSFPKAHEPYTDHRPMKLILQEIEMKSTLENGKGAIDFEYQGIKLR